MTPPRTAAALIIGNELLTGKVRDGNTVALGQLLFASGVMLRRVVHCPDEIEVIAEELSRLASRYDFVVTSGGVGPTHDDVTVPAVGRALGRSLVRSSEIESLLERFLGADRPGYERMSLVPEGAELIAGSCAWPLLKVANVFVLPGLPEIFCDQLRTLGEHLGCDRPFISPAVHTRADEGEIAGLLARLNQDHPEVAIGSYPRLGEALYRVAVTFDGRDGACVERAVQALIEALPADQIVDLGSKARA